MMATTRKKKADAEKINAVADTIKPVKRGRTPERGLLPSGLTLLDLAMSDSLEGGIGAGKIINIIGERSVGKTLLAQTAQAVMCEDPKFDNYDLVLDDGEFANEFALEKMFGQKYAERVQAPRYVNDMPMHSVTAEDWVAAVQSKINNAKKTGRPFFYVLDSLDSLTDDAEVDSVDDLTKQADKGVEDVAFKGSYNMHKAKIISQGLRVFVSGIAETKSVLVVLSQTRDNVNAGYGQKTKRRSGGRALDFYCSHIIWLTSKKTLKHGKAPAVGKKDLREIIGHRVEAEISKNKLTGKLRKVEFSTYNDYGVDDTAANIQFLIDYGFLTQSRAYVDATPLGYDGNYFFTDLVKAIEEDGKEQQIREFVADTWHEKENNAKLDRKPRFGG